MASDRSAVRVGTSGWSYPTGHGTWNGVFYPRRRPRGFDELAYYAERFDIVEVNSTFYRVPEAPLTRRWAERTPAGFLFAVKVYQKFTHPDMYLAKRPGAEWHPGLADLDLFRAGIEPLAAADRLGPLLVQFPASFHAGEAEGDYLSWLLDALHGYEVAVEVRHGGWFADEAHDQLQARLAAARAALVVADSPETTGFRVGFPGLPPGNPTRNPFLYFRFHGRNAASWWHHEAAEDRYNYLYSPDELRPAADAMRDAAAAGRRVVAFMNNHFSAKAVANAAVLRSQLGQDLPADYEPELVERYPDLRGRVTVSGLFP